MAGKVAYNAETGEAVRFDGNSWVPTKVATHERTGAKVAFDGNEWVSVGGEKQPAQSEIGGVVDAFTQGATFGFGDELTGLEAGLLGRTPEGDWFNYDKSFGERYQAARDAERRQQEAYSEQSPVLSTAAEIGGAIASPVNKLIAPMMAAPTLAGRVGRGAAVGTGLGAVSGAGDAETMADIPAEAAKGAVLGGGVGALAPVAAHGISNAYAFITSKLINKYQGNVTKAQQKLFNAIKNVGDGDYNTGLQRIEQRIQSGSADDALVDMLGMDGLKMARAVANMPGKSAEIIDDFVSGRVAGRGVRLESAADELTPSKFYDDLEGLTASQRAQSMPLREKAFQPMSDAQGRVYAPWDERLQQFLDDPIIKQGMAKGMRTQQLEALAEGRSFNPMEYAVKGFDKNGGLIIEGTPNLRAMDAAKRGLDEILEGYRDSTTGKLVLDERGRAIDKVRKALISKLDDITTDVETGISPYKQARQAFAEPAQIKDAMWKGRQFMRGDAEITEKVIKGMNDAQKEAYRTGVRRELSDMIQKDTQTAIAKFADKKQDLWRKLRMSFSDEQSFNKFRDEIGMELERARTEKFISPRIGAQTTPLKEDIAEFQRAPNAILDALQMWTTGNRAAALGHMANAPIDYMRRPDMKTAQSMAEALTAQGSQNIRNTLSGLGNVREIKMPQNTRDAIARALLLGGQ